MAINFKNYSVQELRSYLQSRLIAATKFNKRKLIELAEYAHDLKLEIIEEDDYKDLCKERRRISTKEGQSHYVIDVSEVKDWTVDLRGVPSVETGDIMIYLLSTCQWSDDRLRDYKQDNGYKLYMCNHISDVKLYKTDTLGYMYVHANCLPETRQSADPYNTWVYDLCKGSSAGFLKLVDPPSDESESDEETAEYFSDMLRGLSESDDILECLHNKHDNAYIYNVEQGTIGQRDNPEWQKHRKCRITASVISNIMKCNFDQLSSNHYLVKNFLGTSISFRSDATEFGIKMEKVAKTQYFDRFKTQHKKSSFKDCGLFVSKASPFLGASPDGVVKCKCCGTRLVEIKCTFKYADKTPMEVANLQTYHVQNINGEIKLKTSSPWYYQIQTQLGVCGRDICDFVLFTSKAISVET
ncbi:unnamed protein product [Mytilus edulis]|uniref:YqaJ viral recombinase domain-containing protein n=1 Tax=Mytilus edulis TaxID=6550 RepID=A0A8S3SN33_MYTED|nr:unnamed protein product [Mytilus edulis]